MGGMGARTLGASPNANDAARRVRGPTVLVEHPLDARELVELGFEALLLDHAPATVGAHVRRLRP